VTQDLGRRWELEQIALRLWPSASLTQGLTTALFDLVETHRFAPDRVAKLRIALSPTAFDMHGKLPRYKAKFEALISGHYTAAAILHDRALTLAQFEPRRYDDPALRRCAAEQVEIRADPALTGTQTIVEAELSDGSSLSARSDHPRGAPERPLSWAEVEAKFRTYAEPLLSRDKIDAVVEMVGALERLGSVAELMALLRAEGVAARG
jgi:2-methylcitrate dehydratase